MIIMKLGRLVKHWLEYQVEPVSAIILGPVYPLVVPIAVHQAGKGHFVWLDGGWRWKPEGTSAEA